MNAILSRSATSINRVPDDILLHIIRFVSLGDIVSFMTTCSALHRLAKQRGFWISVLRSARMQTPLAYPLHEDLSSNDIESLKSVAFHRLRLERNWSRRMPDTIGPVKAILCRDPVNILFLIPGTDIAVLHSTKVGGVSCWDFCIGKPSSLGTINLHREVIAISQPYERCGEFLIAVLSNEEAGGHMASTVHVLQIDYCNRKATNFQEKYRWDLPANLDHRDIFLHENVVGVVQSYPDASSRPCIISAINIKTQNAVIIETNLRYAVAQVGCYVFEGHIYLVAESENSSSVHHFPRDTLPYGEENKSVAKSESQFTIAGPFTWGKRDQSFMPICVIASGLLHGVGAVSIRRVFQRMDNLNVASTTIRFWPHLIQNDPQSPLKFYDAEGCTASLPGKIQLSASGLTYLTCVGSTGAHVLAIVELEDGRLSLLLVTHHPDEKGSTSIHDLKIPAFIDLRHISGLSFDDRQGIVYLINTSGIIFSLPYA